MRADLNVPLDKSQKITDDTRIRSSIPTLKLLVENGAKVLLTSHLVRLISAEGLCGFWEVQIQWLPSGVKCCMQEHTPHFAALPLLQRSC